MPIGVGVIGAGTVGGGVIQTLLENKAVAQEKSRADVLLTHVAEPKKDNLKEFNLENITISQDANALIQDPNVAIVCELMGGIEPAKTFIIDALNAGKDVVTANKMLLATHGPELCEVAVANAVELRYEAAVAGAIPIIKAIRESLAANNIHYLYGIVNGTCNYILTRMTDEGLEFANVLQQAVEKGFAETPPDLDVEGHDTAHKCQIMASLCYSTKVNLDDILVEGITKITHADVTNALDMGYIIKLLAIIRCDDGEIEARVHPTLIPRDHLLASVRYEFNAIYINGDIAGDTLYYGRGAGRLPTASAVVADILDIATRKGAPAPPPFVYERDLPLRDQGRLKSRYYLRLTTEDKPGVLGKVCSILGECGVSIASCSQREKHPVEAVPVVMMTHETLESHLRQALATVDNLEFIKEPTHVIRVL